MGPTGMVTAPASDLALVDITDLAAIIMEATAMGLADITDTEAVTTVKSASGASRFAKA